MPKYWHLPPFRLKLLLGQFHVQSLNLFHMFRYLNALRTMLHAISTGNAMFWAGCWRKLFHFFQKQFLVFFYRIVVINFKDARNIHAKGTVHAITAACTRNGIFLPVRFYCPVNNPILFFCYRLKICHGLYIIFYLFHSGHAAQNSKHVRQRSGITNRPGGCLLYTSHLPLPAAGHVLAALRGIFCAMPGIAQSNPPRGKEVRLV